MKTFVLIYDGFVQFEMALSCMFLKTKSDIVTVALEDRDVTCNEGFILRPHMLLKDMPLDDVDMFLIPGGQHKNIYGNELLSRTLQALNRKGKPIAAICSGPLHLAKAGLLKGKNYTSHSLPDYADDFEGAKYVNDHVVVDGNIVTAKAIGYVDLAFTLGKMAGVFQNEADYEENLRYYKYFQEPA